MICPECKKGGLKSRVAPGVGMRTAMYCAPFYDEEGRHHDHDVNTTTYECECSNGHKWMEESKPAPCWCGWPGKKKEETYFGVIV